MKLIFEKIKSYNITLESLFMILDHQRAKLYDNTIIVDECTKLMNHIYNKIFKIVCPTEIKYTAPKDLSAIVQEIGVDMISQPS